MKKNWFSRFFSKDKNSKQCDIPFVVRSLRKKGNKYWFDCDCGKKYSVSTNVYDNSNSGCGSCDCGKCRSYVN